RDGVAVRRHRDRQIPRRRVRQRGRRQERAVGERRRACRQQGGDGERKREREAAHPAQSTRRNAKRYSVSAETTEMTRPRRPVLKSTVPALLAKIVSSLPMPTPVPGLKRVPRWRTMISPPVTVWPANTFTPRRLAFESRPLREEPRPFLCAISSSPPRRSLFWRPLFWRRRP